MIDLMGDDTPSLRLQAIPPDIRTKLAEFAIDLDNRRKLNNRIPSHPDI
jgi:hypothetical protein